MATCTHKWVGICSLSLRSSGAAVPVYMALLAHPPIYISAKTRTTSSRLCVWNTLHVITQTLTINCLDFGKLVHAKNREPETMLLIDTIDSFRPVLVPQHIIRLLTVYIDYALTISTTSCENSISIHLITDFCIISFNISMYLGETCFKTDFHWRKLLLLTSFSIVAENKNRWILPCN